MSYTLSYPHVTPTIDSKGELQYPGHTVEHTDIQSEQCAESLARTLGLPYYCVELDTDHTQRVLEAYFPKERV